MLPDSSPAVHGKGAGQGMFGFEVKTLYFEVHQAYSPSSAMHSIATVLLSAMRLQVMQANLAIVSSLFICFIYSSQFL